MSKRAIDLKNSSGFVGRNENTNRFYRDVVKYTPLSVDEETELFSKLRSGTPNERRRAKEMLVNCNQRFVIACAKRWANESTLLDYVNEANIGLMHAIDTFDPTMGFKFSTYAVHHIKRALVNYQQDTASIVRQSNISKTHIMKAKVANKFMQKNERAPTDEELMASMNKNVKRKFVDTRDVIDVRYTYIDAEGLNGDDSGAVESGLDDFYKKSSTTNDFLKLEKDTHNKEIIRSLVSQLSEREQMILTLRYGLNSTEKDVKPDRELEEIADKLGLTTERVRQIEAEAIKKMRAMCKAHKVTHA